MDKKELSNILKTYRKEAKLTQQQVADALEIKRSAYAYYEIGKSAPKLPTLKNIAKLYNISVDVLLEENGHELDSVEQSYSNEFAIKDSFNELSSFEQAVVLKMRLMSNEEKKKLAEMLCGE